MFLSLHVVHTHTHIHYNIRKYKQNINRLSLVYENIKHKYLPNPWTWRRVVHAKYLYGTQQNKQEAWSDVINKFNATKSFLAPALNVFMLLYMNMNTNNLIKNVIHNEWWNIYKSCTRTRIWGSLRELNKIPLEGHIRTVVWNIWIEYMRKREW